MRFGLVCFLAFLSGCQSKPLRVEAADRVEFARKTFQEAAVPEGATDITAILDVDTGETWGCFHTPDGAFGEALDRGVPPKSRPPPENPCWKHQFDLATASLTLATLDSRGWRVVRLPRNQGYAYAAVSTAERVAFFWGKP